MAGDNHWNGTNRTLLLAEDSEEEDANIVISGMPRDAHVVFRSLDEVTTFFRRNFQSSQHFGQCLTLTDNTRESWAFVGCIWGLTRHFSKISGTLSTNNCCSTSVDVDVGVVVEGQHELFFFFDVDHEWRRRYL
jgi:hypothetical protein